MTNSLAHAFIPHENLPAYVYLSTLSPGASRRTQAYGLMRIARLLRPGTNLATCPWWELGYGELVDLRERLAAEHAPNTVNSLISALRGVLRASWKLGLLSGENYARLNDLRCVRAKRVPCGRALELAELAELMATAQQHIWPWFAARDAAIVALLYGAGLRRAELARLRMDDIGRDHTGRRSLAVIGKGNKQRIVWVSAEIARELEAWIDVRGRWRGPVFPRAKDDAAPMNPNCVYIRIKKLVARTELAPCTPHDFRRTMIGELFDAGIDIASIQAVVGHESAATTAKYDRRGERAKVKAADALPVPFKRGE